MDDKFVMELKEGAIRKRLPKAEDLGSVDYRPFRTEKNIERDASHSGEVDDKSDIEKENTEPEEEGSFKKDLLNKVLQFRKERKAVNEIYNILKSQGYSYPEIEQAMYNLIKEEGQPTENRGGLAEDTIRKEHAEEIPTTEQEQAPPKIEEEKSFAKKTDVLTSEFAPLFVKIDKYNETIETLGNLKNYLMEMSKLFGLANELERIRTSNISALNKMYNKATETASRLYSGLLKPKGMKIEGTRESQAGIGKLDEVISDLNKELSILRDEIDKIKSLE